MLNISDLGNRYRLEWESGIARFDPRTPAGIHAMAGHEEVGYLREIITKALFV